MRCLVEEQQETIDIGGVDSGLVVNTWHHIAAVFKSSDKTLALYIDGREVDNDSGTALELLAVEIIHHLIVRMHL